MKATPQTIWQVPVYLPYLQPDLTQESISGAECKIGHPLPPSLISLLREQNGGYIRYSLEDLPHEQIYGIGSNYPSLIDFDWEEVQEYVSFPLTGLVPFDGDGHWHLCLDYRSDSNVPAVSYIDIECDNEQEIAKSFDEYLDLLKVDVEETDFVLPSVDDLEATLLVLGSEMGAPFKPLGSWAHGYPQHRAPGPGNKPEWIWVSPNLVPRGFVRDDDARYEELHDRLPGEGLRYPELPSSSVLVSVTEGLRATLLSACRARSIDIRPLSEYVS